MAGINGIVHLVEAENLNVYDLEENRVEVGDERPEETPSQQQIELAEQHENSKKICLPPFSRKYAVNWFRKLQNEFRIYGISDEVEKFETLVRHLPFKTIRQIGFRYDVYSTRTYHHLKEELLKRYAISDTHPECASVKHRLRSMICHIQLDSKTPSELWSEMVDAAKDLDDEEEMLKEFWLERLPPAVSHVLKIFKKGEIEECIKCADKLALEWQPT